MHFMWHMVLLNVELLDVDNDKENGKKDQRM